MSHVVEDVASYKDVTLIYVGSRSVVRLHFFMKDVKNNKKQLCFWYKTQKTKNISVVSIDKTKILVYNS